MSVFECIATLLQSQGMCPLASRGPNIVKKSAVGPWKLLRDTRAQPFHKFCSVLPLSVVAKKHQPLIKLANSPFSQTCSGSSTKHSKKNSKGLSSD